MSAGDFIREAYIGSAALLAQDWLWLAVFALILLIFGWLWTDAQNAQLDDEPTPDTLSQAQKDALKAWVLRAALPPNAPEIVELAQEWLTLCRETSESQSDRFDNPL